MICELEYMTLNYQDMVNKTLTNDIVSAINAMALDFGWEFVSYAEGLYIFKRPR